QSPRSTLFPYTTLFRSPFETIAPHPHNVPSMLVLGPEPSVLRTLSDRERRRVVRPPTLHRFCLALPATLPIQAGPSLNQYCSLRSEEHTSELQSLAYLV